MAKRYETAVATPITIELYRNPDHYSVRTVGLPNLGALGGSSSGLATNAITGNNSFGDQTSGFVQLDPNLCGSNTTCP